MRTLEESEVMKREHTPEKDLAKHEQDFEEGDWLESSDNISKTIFFSAMPQDGHTLVTGLTEMT